MTQGQISPVLTRWAWIDAVRRRVEGDTACRRRAPEAITVARATVRYA